MAGARRRTRRKSFAECAATDFGAEPMFADAVAGGEQLRNLVADVGAVTLLAVEIMGRDKAATVATVSKAPGSFERIIPLLQGAEDVTKMLHALITTARMRLVIALAAASLKDNPKGKPRTVTSAKA